MNRYSEKEEMFKIIKTFFSQEKETNKKGIFFKIKDRPIPENTYFSLPNPYTTSTASRPGKFFEIGTYVFPQSSLADFSATKVGNIITLYCKHPKYRGFYQIMISPRTKEETLRLIFDEELEALVLTAEILPLKMENVPIFSNS